MGSGWRPSEIRSQSPGCSSRAGLQCLALSVGRIWSVDAGVSLTHTLYTSPAPDSLTHNYSPSLYHQPSCFRSNSVKCSDFIMFYCSVKSTTPDRWDPWIFCISNVQSKLIILIRSGKWIQCFSLPDFDMSLAIFRFI